MTFRVLSKPESFNNTFSSYVMQTSDVSVSSLGYPRLIIKVSFSRVKAQTMFSILIGRVHHHKSPTLSTRADSTPPDNKITLKIGEVVKFININ